MQTIQNSLSQQNKKFRFYIIVFGFVIMGVALATACFYALDKSSLMQLSFVSDYLSDKRLASNPTDILFSSFVTGTLFLIFPFVLGFCAVSKPVLYLIPIFRGIGLGTAICSLYYQLGYKGIIVALVTVIPSSVIMTYPASITTAITTDTAPVKIFVLYFAPAPSKIFLMASVKSPVNTDTASIKNKNISTLILIISLRNNDYDRHIAPCGVSNGFVLKSYAFNFKTSV